MGDVDHTRGVVTSIQLGNAEALAGWDGISTESGNASRQSQSEVWEIWEQSGIALKIWDSDGKS